MSALPDVVVDRALRAWHECSVPEEAPIEFGERAAMRAAVETLGPIAPTPAWHRFEVEQGAASLHLEGDQGASRFGFEWQGRFVEQLWTPELQKSRHWLKDAESSEAYDVAVRDLPPATVFRHKLYGYLCGFAGYNRHGLGEFIAVFEDGERSSETCFDYYPVNGKWPEDR